MASQLGGLQDYVLSVSQTALDSARSSTSLATGSMSNINLLADTEAVPVSQEESDATCNASAVLPRLELPVTVPVTIFRQDGSVRKVAIAQLHTRLHKVVRQPVIRRAAVALNLRQTTRYKKEDFDLAWFAGVKDVSPAFFTNKIASYPHRMVNRFPRVREALGKSNFSRLMEAFYQVSPSHRRFAPKTFIERLPEPNELAELEVDTVMILKPNLARGGTGIHLKALSALKQEEDVLKQVGQVYLAKPLLLNGYKFDLRLYVLVTSLDPLIAYLYDDGLVRVCTETYQAPAETNLANLQMHLTNYAVNKTSDKFKSRFSAGFSPEEDAASDRAEAYCVDFDVRKRTDVEGVQDADMPDSKQNLLSLYAQLEAQGCNVATIQHDIQECVCQALVAMAPMLRVNTKDVLKHQVNAIDGQSRCFQVLGFDLMLDEDGKPWMIEVNTNPSLLCGTAVDWIIKEPLAHATLAWVQQRATPIVQHLIAHSTTMQATGAPSAPSAQTSPPRPRGKPPTRQPTLNPLGFEWEGPAMTAVPPVEDIPCFTSLQSMLNSLEACYPYASSTVTALYLQCHVPASALELSELNSKAVIPKTLLYDAVKAQEDTLRNALGSIHTLPPVDILWSCPWSCFNMASFMMAITSTAYYLLEGQPLAQLEHVGALSTAAPKLHAAIATVMEVMTGMDIAAFEIERRSRRPPETSDEDI
eukprot:m.118781 g.118781  ORF g.118781 m.118781 type:complete len:700 (-) comp15575_c1_seq4:833-2932(-)